jgi:hypothetical protein
LWVAVGRQSSPSRPAFASSRHAAALNFHPGRGTGGALGVRGAAIAWLKSIPPRFLAASVGHEPVLAALQIARISRRSSGGHDFLAPIGPMLT